MSIGVRHPAEGESLGPFLILRRIGGGGMGEVFEAEDCALGRRVALKVIAPHLAADPDFRARFVREAQALAALDSPHVVQVHAHGEHDGRLYLAIQLVPDGDLAALLSRPAPLSMSEALGVVAQVADGLASAHAAGVVHRDIKPANVLLRRRGPELHAYLSDFGVARPIAGDETRTRAGSVGTPSYMAPELHTGGAASVASDVYSLGCLLWATMTGTAPYAGGSEFEVATAHLRQPVPQLPGRGARGREVNRILRAAMAKDPAGRPGSAATLAGQLRAALALADGPTSARQLPSRRVIGVIVAAACSVALLAGGIASAVSRDVPHVDAGASAPIAPGTRPDDLEVARKNLARALAAQPLVTRSQARCTAQRWLAEVGLPSMTEAGFFDADLTYVDQPRSAMTPRIEDAATRAAASCASSR